MIKTCRIFTSLISFSYFLCFVPGINATENSIRINELIQQNRTFLSSLRIFPNAQSLLTVEDLIDIALQNNQRLEAVKQKKAQNKGQLTQAKADYLPQLSIEARYFHTKRKDSSTTNPGENPNQATLDTNDFEEDDVAHGAANLSQLIYDFGKTTGKIAVEKSNLDAADSYLKRQIQDTVFQVKKAYFSVLEKNRLIDIASESVKSFQQHLDRSRLYLKAGVRTKIDVINSEVELSKANIGLLRAQYGLKLARVALVEVLGVSPNQGQYGLHDDRIDINNILTTMPHVPTNLDRLIHKAIQQRPDIQQLTNLTKAAEAHYARLEGEYYPTITAEANYNDYESDLSLYKDSWEVGVACTWELFSGFRSNGAVAEAKGRLLESRAQLKKLQLSIIREVTDSYLLTHENQENVRMALQTLELAQENLSLAEKKYESGTYDVIEFNDAQMSLIKTKNELVVTYYGFLTALANIEHAIGSYVRARE